MSFWLQPEKLQNESQRFPFSTTRAEAQLILHLVEHTIDCHMIGSAFVQVESF